MTELAAGFSENIRKALAVLPEKPGVYLMHDAEGKVIYVTSSEVEALILECNLIKKYRPRYNISLKDDKTYPYLKVTVQEDFPRLLVTRRQSRDGAKYYGPYADAGAMHATVKLPVSYTHLTLPTN